VQGETRAIDLRSGDVVLRGTGKPLPLAAGTGVGEQQQDAERATGQRAKYGMYHAV